MEKERFSSRLSFILVSAGCAIGIGNVWKFPYYCGQYGGAAFILLYLVFLLILGIPVMVCEFAIGRKAQRSAVEAFSVLEPKGTRWHRLKWISIFGNVILMMYYTTVSGWMLQYAYLQISGRFQNASPETVQSLFSTMLSHPFQMLSWTVLVCVIGALVCRKSLASGVEKISRIMMVALLLIMIVLAFHSLLLPNAQAGIRYYLVPDFRVLLEKGVGTVIFAAMSQAFFTLSIGIGSMLIFGSYLDANRSLCNEACMITALDTFVALLAGLIIIPACFSFGVDPDAGPRLIFLIIPNIFARMPLGRLWGTLFFVFLSFAALTTVIAVFENIVSFGRELFHFSRSQSALWTGVALALLSIPCVLGFNIWSSFQPLGPGSSILDLEDFIVSNNLLPLGGLCYTLFCTRPYGWGWDAFRHEANRGVGLRFRYPKKYVQWGIPAIILLIYLRGYYAFFIPQGPAVCLLWMLLAILFSTFVIVCTRIGGKSHGPAAGD